MMEMAAAAKAVSVAETLTAVTRLVVVHRREAATASEVIHLFALELVLDALAVGSIADQWENRTNALNKEHALLRVSIVKRGLQRH